MERDDLLEPASPTEIGLATGLGVPGLTEVRGPQEEGPLSGPLNEAAEGPGPGPRDARRRRTPDLVPGQSGAEGLADLPNAGPDDPRDGP